MENGKQVGSLSSSSSSFTNDLFGSRDSAQPPAPNETFFSIFPPPSTNCDLFGSRDSAQPPAPNETFFSIFPPPSTVLGMRASVSEQMESRSKYYMGNLFGDNKGITVKNGICDESYTWDFNSFTEDASKNKEVGSYCALNKEGNSIFQERSEPCPLSSSLYYGGQEDMYVCSSNAKDLGSYQDFKKEGGEDDKNGDDSHVASRGNWWEGSLYY